MEAIVLDDPTATDEKPNRIAQSIEELAAATRGDDPPRPLETDEARRRREEQEEADAAQARVDGHINTLLPHIVHNYHLPDPDSWPQIAKVTNSIAWAMERERSKGAPPEKKSKKANA